MNNRVLQIVSDVDKSHHLEWLTFQIVKACDLRVILIGQRGTRYEEFLRSMNVPTEVVEYRVKLDLFRATLMVWRLLRNERPHIVHCHFWLAQMIGIPVSFALRIRHRVITRHHGNIHHRQHLKGVWIDIILNKLTTLIISPTQTIKDLLVQKEHVDPTKVHVVNHGIDERYYASKDKNAQKRLRDKYAIPETHPIIGVISRHIDWKGIQYIIPAFEKLLHQSKGAHLILANAIGPYRSTVEKLLTPLPANSYTMIEYESDVSSLYSLFDYFVHVPIDSQSESFGLVYIEALAAGVPSVFTLSGVAPDFVKNKYNAMVVDFMNSDQIYVALTTLMNDSTLVQQLIDNGRKSAQCYSSSTMGEKIRNLYEQMESGRSILSL